MYVLLGGDIRPHVIDALQFLVDASRANALRKPSCGEGLVSEKGRRKILPFSEAPFFRDKTKKLFF